MATRMNLQRFRMSPPKKEGMPIPHISKLFVMCISQKCKGVAWMSHRLVFFLTTDRSRAGGSQPMLTTTLCRLLRRQASGRGCWRKTSCDAGLADAAGFGIAQARVSGPSAWMRLPSIHACQRRHAFRFPQRDDFPLVSFVGSILCNSHVALLLYFACLSLGTFP